MTASNFSSLSRDGFSARFQTPESEKVRYTYSGSFVTYVFATMSPNPSESDPLIARTRTRASNGEGLLTHDESRPPGPLEISRTTRYGILAGMWLANFLAVCPAYLSWPFPATYEFISPEGHKSYCLASFIVLELMNRPRISCSDQYARFSIDLSKN